MDHLKLALSKLERSLSRFETSLDDRLRQEKQFRESVEQELRKEREDRALWTEETANMTREMADRIDHLVAEIGEKLKQNEQG